MATTTKRRVPVRADVKPLYALAGAGDLVVERLRTLPTELQKQLATVPTELQQRALVVSQLPAQVQRRAEEVQTRATKVYGQLANRGQKAVKQLRGQTRPTAKKTAAKAS